MKIADRIEPPGVTFRQIKQGQPFLRNGILFFKIESDGGETNTVSLQHGTRYALSPDDVCELVNAEIVIRPH